MRLFRFLGILLLLAVLLPVLAVQFFGGAIAREVVAALNQRLQTEIVIQAYDLSLLRSFPYLSADLRGVTVAGSDGSRLLEAERVACRLDLASLFGKVRINGIRVVNGRLQLLTDVDGNPNYLLTGYTSVGDRGAEAAVESGVDFQIEEARLTRVELIYLDRQLRTDAHLTVSDATFSGVFGAKAYELTTDAELFVNYLDQDEFRYLSGESLRLLGRTSIDHAAGRYTLDPLRIYSGELSLEAAGTLRPTAEGLETDLRLSSRSGTLEDVFALLPPVYSASLEDLETSGALSLAASVVGSWTTTDYPRIDGRLDFTEGRVGSPRLEVDAKDLELAATFAYLDGPRGGVQTFEVEHLTGTFSGEPFDLGLRLENLKDPVITFRADGSLPLSLLPALLDEAPGAGGAGTLRLRGVSLTGRYADMLEPRRMGRVASSGTIVVEDAEVELGDHRLSFPAGTLVLRDNALSVGDLAVETNRSSFTFSGEATNLIPVLFSDSLNTRDAALVFEARLTGDRFDVQEMLDLFEPASGETAATPPPAGGPPDRGAGGIMELLDGRFEAEIATWTWDKLEGEDFRGQLIFAPGQLTVRGVCDAMEGEFRVDATTDFGLLTHTAARITATGVDAPQFFAQNDEFGQDFLTSANLEGRMNARLLLDLYYDDAGAVDYNRLRAMAGLEILDGELHDFDLLENFAFALKTGDLERVRFTRLSNYIEIADRTVYLPAMFVQSSAINLTVSGSHTFDQYLEYYIKVNAGQVIANKISRHNDRLEVLPARNGLFNLYYTITGPLEDYRVETDKQAVKNDFRRSELRRERIRRTLAERFASPIELVPPVNDGDLTD